VHCVFSTKQRANLIRNPEARWRYLAAIARDMVCILDEHVPSGAGIKWNMRTQRCALGFPESSRKAGLGYK